MSASPLLRRYATTPEGALSALREGIGHGDTFIVVRTETGSPQAMAWLQHLRGFGAAAYLRLLLVTAAYQRHGIGRRLLEAAEEHASTWSRHLLLLVTEDNHAARRFYEN